MGASARIICFSLMLFTVSAWVTKEDAKNGGSEDEGLLLQAPRRSLIKETSKVLAKLVELQNRRPFESEPATAASESASDEVVGQPQSFFPSIANLFEPRANNYRLGFGNPEAAFSQRPNSYRSLLNYPVFGGLSERFRSLEGYGKQETQSSAPIVDAASSVLGSGNFGIIRGGTFNAQNDEDEFDSYNSFYNNGHGRPAPAPALGYIANPRPNYSQDQFANFRDFADINTPANSAYSHYVVVYANKNATMDEISEESRPVSSQPKNIIETLSQLDEEPVKISKKKAKLELMKQKIKNKKHQWKKATAKYVSHDDEPLLALS